MAKYIIVAGGVVSGGGKGITAGSIGLLLKLRGYSVTIIKFDPYLNVNCGILQPQQHGEVFLCNDKSETDLDLGHYERLANIPVGKDNICTSGTLYKELIEEQEEGKYLGQTIQIIPHLTNKFQDRLLNLGKNHDIVIAEIGGTCGDNESFAFFEAIRQFKQTYRDNVLVAMVAPILYLNTVQEFKTKPLQSSVRELQSFGIQPDVIFCRCDRRISESILDKVANTCGVPKGQVFEALDVSTIYQVPLEFYDRHVDDLIVDLLRLKRTRCKINEYREIVEKLNDPNLPVVNIGIFGKYENCDEAYLSLKEALVHSGAANNAKVNIVWVASEDLEKYKDNRGLGRCFSDLHGIIIPGGFGARGIEGKIKAIQYAREKGVPFLGICLGLQCAAIEFARNVCLLEDANSLEFNQNTLNPVIHFVEGQESITKKSGTMRLGAFDCLLTKDSLAHRLYGSDKISERHRHRYEVNDKYTSVFEEKNFVVSGRNPENDLIEVMELKTHPFFIGTQAHPEFKSKLTDPAPLFRGLVEAALKFKTSKVEE